MSKKSWNPLSWLTKSSKTTRAIGRMFGYSMPAWTDTENTEQRIKAHLVRNPTEFACLDKVTKAVAGIEWFAFELDEKGKRKDVQHPIVKLLKKPNDYYSGATMNLMIAMQLEEHGKCFIEVVRDGEGQPNELYVHRAERVWVYPGDKDNPVAYYEYRVGNEIIRFEKEDIIFIKYYNPIEDFDGLAPSKAAGSSIDVNNKGRLWNYALLDNYGQPGGVVKSEDNLTDDQFTDIVDGLTGRHSGAKNAGRFMVLEAGLDYDRTGLTPAEMSWEVLMDKTDHEICRCHGVPPQLLGLPGSQTYANYQEARKAFYIEKVLPMCDIVVEAFNIAFMGRRSEVFISYDKDKIDAIQEDRAAVWTRAIDGIAGGLCTPNEAREEVKLEEHQGADLLLVSSALTPMPGTPGAEEQAAKQQQLQQEQSTFDAEQQAAAQKRNMAEKQSAGSEA